MPERVTRKEDDFNMVNAGDAWLVLLAVEGIIHHSCVVDARTAGCPHSHAVGTLKTHTTLFAWFV